MALTPISNGESGSSARTKINNAFTAVDLKASLSGATFTGTVVAPALLTSNTIFPTRTLELTTGAGVQWSDVNGSGFSVVIRPDAPSANRTINFNPNGNFVSTADVGTVTDAMLAGSIALSKLSTTGTASSSTYLRGDGAWSSVSSDAATADRTAANPTDWTFRWNAVTTTGTIVTLVVKEGDVTGTLTSVADADLIGTETLASLPVQATARTSEVGKNVTKRVGYKGIKRYVTVDAVSTGTTSVGCVSVEAILHSPELAPQANP